MLLFYKYFKLILLSKNFKNQVLYLIFNIKNLYKFLIL